MKKRISLISAIRNLKDQFLSKILEERVAPNRTQEMILYRNVREIIDIAFDWSGTPEGRRFWLNVSREFRSYGYSPLIEQWKAEHYGFKFKKNDRIVIGPSTTWYFSTEEDEIDTFTVRKSIMDVQDIVLKQNVPYLSCLRNGRYFYFRPEDMSTAKHFLDTNIKVNLTTIFDD